MKSLAHINSGNFKNKDNAKSEKGAKLNTTHLYYIKGGGYRRCCFYDGGGFKFMCACDLEEFMAF